MYGLNERIEKKGRTAGALIVRRPESMNMGAFGCEAWGAEESRTVIEVPT